jgi:hypothetical protein
MVPWANLSKMPVLLTIIPLSEEPTLNICNLNHQMIDQVVQLENNAPGYCSFFVNLNKLDKFMVEIFNGPSVDFEFKVIQLAVKLCYDILITHSGWLAPCYYLG